MSKWLRAPTAVLALCCAAGSAVAAPPAPPAAAQSVEVETLVAQQITSWNELSGRLEAVESVIVRPRVGGILRTVDFREGAIVRKGDVLATIDVEPYAAEVARLEGQVAAAVARLHNARTELARTQALFEEDAVARRELDERANAHREADGNLFAAMSALRAARLNVEYTRVRAPIAGRVGKREITVGNLVTAGADPTVLTTLVSVSPIYAGFEAEEDVVVQALKGLPAAARTRAQLADIPVEVRTAGRTDASLSGQLQFVDNRIDARTGTMRMRAVFDNKDGVLIPGQFVTVRLGRATRTNALLLSERAISTDQNKKYVFVVGNDNRARYREVSVGERSAGKVTVLNGLNAGERVIVNGLQRVRPGALVSPQPASAPLQSAAAGVQRP